MGELMGNYLPNILPVKISENIIYRYLQNYL